MKTIRLSILGILLVTTVLLFQNCDKKDDESTKEVATNLLTSKEWDVSSVNVPSGTATLSADWDSFKVSFTASNITTSGHPSGSQAVWPSGAYTLSENANSITRHDGVVMQISSLTDIGFTVSFAVPEGTETGARIAALDGEYTFNMINLVVDN